MPLLCRNAKALHALFALISHRSCRRTKPHVAAGIDRSTTAEYARRTSAHNLRFHDVPGNSYSLEVVAPASERTVNRNRPVTTAMLTETAETYASVTAPHIDRVVGDGKALQWLFNVLSKEKEADRILYEDEDPVRAVFNILHVCTYRWWSRSLGEGLCCVRTYACARTRGRPLAHSGLFGRTRAATQAWRAEAGDFVGVCFELKRYLHSLPVGLNTPSFQQIPLACSGSCA